MKGKKLLDLIISCFLVSTLCIATFIVSCSDEENLLFPSQHQAYNPGQHGAYESDNLLTDFFTNVVEGAEGTIGSDAIGWLFSAMGIAKESSTDSSQQLSEMKGLLSGIQQSLDTTNYELRQILSLLNVTNCNVQQNTLSGYISNIKTYNDLYTSWVGTSITHNVIIPDVQMNNWSNSVLDKQNGIANSLSNISTNLGSSASAISACLPTFPLPSAGTFQSDTVYYSKALGLLNYYYYWQVTGLALISEAKHYKAWIAAGRPGLHNGYSSDSSQKVCQDTGSVIVDEACDYVKDQANQIYNVLLPQFQYVGAPYTGQNLIYQKNKNNEDVVWVRSLEDYTAQSGAHCNYPLNSGGHPYNCGPTSAKAHEVLSVTTYYGTRNFQFPGFKEMKGLVENIPSTFGGKVGDYLDNTLGFENMNLKILLADTLKKVKNTSTKNASDYIDTVTLVPFIMGGNTPVTFNGTKHFIVDSYYAIFCNGVTYSNQFCYPTCGGAFPYTKIGGWAPSVFTFSSWLFGQGTMSMCLSYIGVDSLLCTINPFHWKDTSNAPGWSYYSKNSNPKPAYFIPVKIINSSSSGCAGTYSQHHTVGTVGVVSKCGQDFINFINENLPKPSTCNMPNPPHPCLSGP